MKNVCVIKKQLYICREQKKILAMKIQLDRIEIFKDVKNLKIELNGVVYRISESVDGKLNINKVSLDGDDDYLRIHPRSGNEIELS